MKIFRQPVYGKVEAYNPVPPHWDRIALYMVEQAERTARSNRETPSLKATSGNTGYSLAMVCSLKGYHCVLTVSSKASQEKLALLRAMGADDGVCPADAEPEDPVPTIPGRNSWPGPSQPFTWGKTTTSTTPWLIIIPPVPEIWRQTEGKITHYVCCAGTGAPCRNGPLPQRAKPGYQDHWGGRLRLRS